MTRWTPILLALSTCNPPRTQAQMCRRTTAYWIDPAFTADQTDQIHQAVGAWERASRHGVCYLELNPGKPVLAIMKAPAWSWPLFDRQAHQPGVVGYWVPDRTIWLMPDRISSKLVDGLFKISVHELGHQLGLPHLTGWSFMRAAIDYTPESESIPPGDVKALCRLDLCNQP